MGAVLGAGPAVTTAIVVVLCAVGIFFSLDRRHRNPADARRVHVAGATYHLVNHGLFKALLFLSAGAVVHSTGVTSLADMGGLARKRPLLTAAFTVGALSIAGVPPLNGYASLGLIHKGLADRPVVLGCALAAQVLTVAALGRAAYLGFYRRRSEEYEHLEPMRSGMKISLVLLSLGCVAFGALAGPFVARVAGPASAGLLHPEAYASGALGAAVALPDAGVSFRYMEPKTLGLLAVELLLGVILLRLALRRGGVSRLLGWLGWLKRLHTGSVNDYAAFAAVGMIVSACALLL